MSLDLPAFAVFRRWAKAATAIVVGIATIHSRVSALEKALERSPGECCPHCGLREFRVAESLSVPVGHGTKRKYHVWRCEKCGFSDRWAARHPLDRPPAR